MIKGTAASGPGWRIGLHAQRVYGFYFGTLTAPTAAQRCGWLTLLDTWRTTDNVAFTAYWT